MEQTFDLNKMGLAPMTGEEMQEIDGGFFPIIIYGVMLLTASETFACFLAGVGVGVAVAQGQKK
jgi:hypothetical protein